MSWLKKFPSYSVIANLWKDPRSYECPVDSLWESQGKLYFILCLNYYASTHLTCIFACFQTTSSGKSYKFECQHGPAECLANKVHACGMNMISNPDTRIQYAACMIADNWNPESAGSSVCLSHIIVTSFYCKQSLKSFIRICKNSFCCSCSVPKNTVLIGRASGLVRKEMKEVNYWHFMVRRLTKLAI